MMPVSSKWAPALAENHGAFVTVTATYDGSVTVADVPFTDGSISVDGGSDVRRALSLSLPDPSVFPVDETDPFAVYGQQLTVAGGIRYIDGTAESVPMGTFVITGIAGDIHYGPLTLTGASMEILVKREPFETATSVDGTVTCASFIRSQIQAAVPLASFADRSTDGGNDLPPKTWDAGSDRWAALQEAALSVGCELFVDAAGTFVLQDVPDIDTATPVWDVSAGSNGVMVSAARGLSVDSVYNRVIATGENASENVPPVMGDAKIDDSSDPLRWDGPFGRVTKHYSSSLLTSTGRAQGAANALLLKVRAPNRTVALASVPNFALDASDCIRAVYGDVAPNELHLVQSFTVPLSVTSGGDFAIQTVSGKEEIQ